MAADTKDPRSCDGVRPQPPGAGRMPITQTAGYQRQERDGQPRLEVEPHEADVSLGEFFAEDAALASSVRGALPFPSS